ncbi:MAG: AI-2E family transporter [Duodenibacillus sp.]|nr:AI-2E family transporter [Duodenibacillus sp.]
MNSSFKNYKFSLHDRVDTLVRLAFGGLILVGCYFVVAPFMTSIILAAILAVVSWPLYMRARESCGGHSTLAASLMVCLIVITVLIPLFWLTGIIARQLPEVIVWVKAWIANGMPLPAWLTSLPYVGPWLDETFTFGIDAETLASLLQRIIDPVYRSVLTIGAGIGSGLFQIALVAFIVFFFYRDGRWLAERMDAFLGRISGSLATEFRDILVKTTRSVVFGVIGTAIGQGVVAGVGFWIAKVPGLVLLSVLVCILSVVPMGPPLVWIPVAVWLFATGHTAMSVFLVVWGVLAVSSVDNFIKPLLISRGTSLPLALVFLGVFGGILSFGFLGLVLGPILLAATMAMFQAWIRKPMADKLADEGEPEEPAEPMLVDTAEQAEVTRIA